ncbi:Crp/Fnr family transcriptional regulator [Bacteroidota bacterium]
MNSDNSIQDFPCRDFMPFVQLLTVEQIDLLRNNSNIVSYNKKDSVFRQGTRTSHIMLMASGLVKIFKEGRNERTVLLRMASPGEYIGMLSVMGDQIHQYSATAVGPSEICFIDINAFRNILMENGKFSLRLITLISQDGLFIFNRLINQTHKQLPGRIADVLLYFAEDIYGKSQFDFPLTRRELAELAGTTKESFIRTLTEFKHDKIINLDGSRVQIISMDIVKTLSELG